MYPDNLLPFLIRAKQHTYASGMAPTRSSRPGSHDLLYKEEPFLYMDTYLGGYAFIGEEAVWRNGVNIWGMNYYGKMLVKDIPEGFSAFLKQAMMLVSLEYPYRGPSQFSDGDYLYTCSNSGSFASYNGEEFITLKRIPIYQLYFHGGEIKD